MREFLHYEYAKIIANRALGTDKKASKMEKELKRYCGFVRNRFEKMKRGVTNPSGVIMGNKMLVQKDGQG